MSEVRRLERGQFQMVAIGGTASLSSSFATQYEAALVQSESGDTAVVSGPPPFKWNVRLEAPPDGSDPANIERTVSHFVSAGAERWHLRYFESRSIRLAIGTTLTPRPVAKAVWALTGHVFTRGGRLVTIGRSGRGCGLAWLSSEPAREALAWQLSAIDNAEPAESTTIAAVLSPAASAVLVHEAIGHFIEASPQVDLRHRIGVRVASQVFDLSDDPQAEGGTAEYTLDDDGVASLSPTQVLREGRLISLLHSLESAARACTSSTANSRAASVWHTPMPRISNLICGAGTATEEQLLGTMGSGIYIHSLSDGWAYGNRVEARIRLAERVELGRRTGRFVTGGAVSEDRFMLTRGVELGNESLFCLNGMCGKAGEMLYDVGTRAPAIRMSSLCIRS